jgi:hypothetical protein
MSHLSILLTNLKCGPTHLYIHPPTIIELFGFPEDSRLLTIELMKTILETDDEDCIREKIQLIQTLTQDVKKSRNI